MGFEPMLPYTNTNGLANRPLQPLEYSSLLCGTTWFCPKFSEFSVRRNNYVCYRSIKAMIYSAYKKPKKTMAKNLQDSPK